MKIKQIVGEATGDALGTVSTAPDASGKVKIKTPTGTEIETNKDALLPGAKPGTVQMKPDAAGDALKPGTEVVSAEAIEDTAGEVSIDSAEGFKAQLKKEAGEAGLDPAAVASIEKMVAIEPDGSVDVDQTMLNMVTAFNDLQPQILEMYAGFIKMFEDAVVSPEFKTFTPEEQKSIQQSLADMKAQYPKMQKDVADAQAEFKQQQPAMQAQVAARKTAKVGTAQTAPAAPTEELNRIKELAGVKDEDIVSPRFAGVQQTQHDDGSKTTDYQQGPLQATKKVDAQGNPITSKTTYDLGVGKLGSEQDHVSGIRTNTATPADPNADPNDFLPTKDIAAAKGIDAKKFAAFQKQNPAAVKESPDLTAMLRIAGLR
jgi:hypothetical protein